MKKRHKRFYGRGEDMNGKRLRINDRVKVALRDEHGCKNHANEGYPSSGVITGWDGIGVAEVRAPATKTRGGYVVNWEPNDHYSISTNQLTLVRRGKRR